VRAVASIDDGESNVARSLKPPPWAVHVFKFLAHVVCDSESVYPLNKAFHEAYIQWFLHDQVVMLAAAAVAVAVTSAVAVASARVWDLVWALLDLVGVGM